MGKRLKGSVSATTFAAVCVVMLCGFTTLTAGQQALVVAQVKSADLAISNMAATDEATRKARDEYAGQCMALDSSVPKTGNGVIDMRCSLVAFEVCMNRKTGIISQSQGAKQNCAIIKGIGGAAACKVPCDAATTLPVGGDGTAGRYKGLTPAAVACYDQRIVAASNQTTPGLKACGVNLAVTACLYNGSSSPSVNAAILREAKAGCASFHKKYPGETCSACTGWQLNHTN